MPRATTTGVAAIASFGSTTVLGAALPEGVRAAIADLEGG